MTETNHLNGSAEPLADPVLRETTEQLREELQSSTDREALPGLTEAELANLAKVDAKLANPKTALQQAENMLDAQIKGIIGVMIRGLMISSPGVPPDALLRSVARTTAQLMGDAFAGELVPVMKVRQTIIEAFTTALKKTPIKTPPSQQHGPSLPIPQRQR